MSRWLGGWVGEQVVRWVGAGGWLVDRQVGR